MIRDQKMLLVSMILYFCAVSVTGVFINLFIFSASLQSSSDATTTFAILNVLKYNLYTYLFILVFSSFIATKGKSMRQRECMMLGLFLFIILYILLAVLKTKCIDLLLLPAFLNAGGAAFYHMSYNEAMNFSASERSKGAFVSTLNTLMLVMGIVLPIVTALVIGEKTDFKGYVLIFEIVTGLLIVAMAVSYHISFPHQKKRRTCFLSVLIKSVKNKTYRLSSFGELVQGIKEGVMTFIIPIVLYITSASVIVTAVYVAVVAIIRTLSISHIEKRITHSNMMGILFIGTAAACVSVALFAGGITAPAVFAFGVFNAFFYGHTNVPTSKCCYFATKDFALGEKRFIELLSVREIYLNVGKIIGVVIFMFLYSNYQNMIFAILIVNALQFVSWILYLAIGEAPSINDKAVLLLGEDTDSSDSDGSENDDTTDTTDTSR